MSLPNTKSSIMRHTTVIIGCDYLTVCVFNGGDVWFSKCPLHKSEHQGTLPYTTCPKYHDAIVVGLLGHSHTAASGTYSNWNKIKSVQIEWTATTYYKSYTFVVFILVNSWGVFTGQFWYSVIVGTISSLIALTDSLHIDDNINWSDDTLPFGSFFCWGNELQSGFKYRWESWEIFIDLILPMAL
jgi:hypothetical protein